MYDCQFGIDTAARDIAIRLLALNDLDSVDELIKLEKHNLVLFRAVVSKMRELNSQRNYGYDLRNTGAGC
jgi:hypothetical protein